MVVLAKRYKDVMATAVKSLELLITSIHYTTSHDTHNTLTFIHNLISSTNLMSMAFKKSLVVAATMAVAAFGAALEGINDCATTEPSAELLAAAKEMASQEAAKAKINTQARDDADTNVPTYLHVIASSKSKSDGYLSVRLQF